ncbi:MAG: hypothetical protein FWB96_03780 [Defluviitaleaceae bacterium]|nr:hypothetical protein [Defluviitaleaceae bacterium]MCL2262127.1 hypothetical protein [Defluviitaleaceae bacterium]
MYRIICNSLRNYASDFDSDISDPRYRPVYFLRLIENIEEYSRNKTTNTEEYRLLSAFLWSIRDCERSEQILHELKMLGIEGEFSQKTDFSETNRIWQLFLKKAYWRD